MNFNLYSRSHLGNPHPVYAALREERPVRLNDGPRFWAISRFGDVDAFIAPMAGLFIRERHHFRWVLWD
jgi:hypothetical protein